MTAVWSGITPRSEQSAALSNWLSDRAPSPVPYVASAPPSRPSDDPELSYTPEPQDVVLQSDQGDGPYTLQPRPLNMGGFGSVYLAHDAEGRDVAVKYYHSDFTSEGVDREAGLMRFLNQRQVAHVVQWIDGPLSPQPGQFYLVVNYVPGKTLLELLVACFYEVWAETAAWSLSHRLLDVMQQLARIVHNLHEHCVVHRDLKPNNIMVTDRDDGGYEATVIDLGQACAAPGCPASRELSADWQCEAWDVFGTPGYTLPRAVQQNPAFEWWWTDVYSLGVVWARMALRLNPQQHALLVPDLVHTRCPALDRLLSAMLFPTADQPPPRWPEIHAQLAAVVLTQPLALLDVR